MKKNYFKRAFATLLAVIMVLSMVPMGVFAQEDTAEYVTTAAELEEAIASGAEEICIAADFEVDRTYYITRNVNIYSTEVHTITRKADFAGDVFVIGEDADGNVCEEKVILSVGAKDSEDNDILTFDGNKENMGETVVTGTVFFVCKNGQADLYPNLTVKNCEKNGNERTLETTKYVLSNYYANIGGAVGIVCEAGKDDPSYIADGAIVIYGGKYLGNGASVSGSYGGAFFNHGKMYVYDGLFDGGYASRAGAFYNYRTMYIYKATVQNNTSTTTGGAIYLPSSTGAILHLFGEEKADGYDIVFKNNSSKDAGTIYTSGRLTMRNVLFEANSATEGAGAVYGSGVNSRVIAYNCAFNFNTAGDNGGAVYFGGKNDGTVIAFDLTNCSFTENESSSNGGAIYCSGQSEKASVDFILRNSTFTKNKATSNGGAVYIANPSRAYIADSSFVENTAKYGGALDFASTSIAQVKDSAFEKNVATSNGGAIYFGNNSSAYISDSSFNENKATTNGGVAYLDTALCEFNNVTFDKNTAKSGGVVYAKGKSEDKTDPETSEPTTVVTPAKLIMNDVSATNNIATSQGGVGYSTIADFEFYNSSFKKNKANAGSAFYFNESASADMYKVDIEENSCYESNTGNAGALMIYTGGTKITLHTANIKNNISNGAGGGIIISNKSILDLYNVTATGNSAAKGGFMYETTTGTTVTASGLTVSGNTATTGGPIVWGNSTGAKLYINKSTYTDLDVTTELDDAYWKAAIYNSLKVYDSDAVVPEHADYVQPEIDTTDYNDCTHTYETSEVEATCTEDGYTAYTCACGNNYKVYTAVAPGHKKVVDAAVEPDCENTGLTAGSHCSVCDTVFVKQKEVAALGHNNEAVVTAPTCTDAGYTTYTCTVCDASYIDNNVDALGHTAVTDEAVAPDCTNTGLTEGSHCSVCGDTIIAQETVDALGHSMNDGVIDPAPTCEEAGTKTFTCATCGATETETLEALGHTWDEGVVKTEADCENEGSKTFTCTVCGDVKTVITEALGHKEAEAVKENEVAADCENAGSYDSVVYCSVCNKELSREAKTVDALGHTEAEAVKENEVAADCENGGSYDSVVYCSVCNKELSREAKTVDALGHTEAEAVKEKEVAADCENGGSYDSVVYCSVCNKELSREAKTVDALGHSEAEAVIENEVAVGCETDGSYETVVYCSVCNEELSRVQTTTATKLGHTPGEAVIENEVEANCINGGSYDTVIYCSVCNKELSRVNTTTAERLGHTDGDEVVENVVDVSCETDGSYDTVVYCLVCNEELSRETTTIPATGHTEAIDEAVAPTCTETGLTAGVHCSACGEVITKQEIVDALGHTIVIEEAVEATCTQTGLTEGSYCSVCDEVLAEQTTVAKKGHTYETTTTKATLTANGKKVKKCTVCDYISSSTTIYYPKTIKLSATTGTYNGKVKNPSVTVTDSKGKTLKKDTDYTVKYESGRKNPGKYTVQITFKGNYSGTKKLYFTITPAKTAKIAASQTTTAIKLSWAKVTGATGYRVYKYNTKTKKFEKLKDVTGTSLTISKLSAGTKYSYKVRAYTKDGDTIWGDYSATFETATKPATPSLKVTSTSKGKASLTWSNVAGESGYQIYYSTKKTTDFKKLTSVKANTTKATVTKLTSGKTYYFRVRAYVKTASGTVYGDYKTVAVKSK